MRLLCTSSCCGVLNVVWDLLVDACKLEMTSPVGLEKSVPVNFTWLQSSFTYCFLTCAQYYTHACFCRRHIPYSGLFPWGANFCYFRGSPGRHKIFHPRNLCSAINTCSNLDRWHFVMALFRYLQCPWSTLCPISQAAPHVRAEEVNREVQKAEAWPKENGPIYLLFNVEEPEVTLTA